MSVSIKDFLGVKYAKIWRHEVALGDDFNAAMIWNPYICAQWFEQNKKTGNPVDKLVAQMACDTYVYSKKLKKFGSTTDTKALSKTLNEAMTIGHLARYARGVHTNPEKCLTVFELGQRLDRDGLWSFSPPTMASPGLFGLDYLMIPAAMAKPDPGRVTGGFTSMSSLANRSVQKRSTITSSESERWSSLLKNYFDKRNPDAIRAVFLHYLKSCDDLFKGSPVSNSKANIGGIVNAIDQLITRGLSFDPDMLPQKSCPPASYSFVKRIIRDAETDQGQAFYQELIDLAANNTSRALKDLDFYKWLAAANIAPDAQLRLLSSATLAVIKTQPDQLSDPSVVKILQCLMKQPDFAQSDYHQRMQTALFTPNQSEVVPSVSICTAHWLRVYFKNAIRSDQAIQVVNAFIDYVALCETKETSVSAQNPPKRKL